MTITEPVRRGGSALSRSTPAHVLEEIARSGGPVRPRVPLAWRIFLGAAFVVAATLGGALWLTARAADRAASAAAARAVTAAREQAAAQLDAAGRGLLDGVRVFAQNPTLRSLIATGARDDALDQAIEAAERLGATWVQIVDARGVRLAKSDEPNATPESLAGSALIRRALDGEAVAAFGTSGDSAIFHAVVAPLEGATRGDVSGALMATRLLDAASARALGTAAAGDVVFYALPRSGGVRLGGSTLEVTDELRRVVTTLAEGTELPAATGDAGRAAGVALSSAEIGDDRYFAQTAPLRSADGRAVGGVAVLRAQSAELAAFRDLERTMLLAGGAGLVLALLVASLIARQITRPLAGLVTAARRAAAGDYSAEIDVQSRDEVGVLAAAFGAMLADLREKQVLVEFARLAPSRSSSNRASPAPSPVESGARTAGRRAGDGATAPIARRDVEAADEAGRDGSPVPRATAASPPLSLVTGTPPAAAARDDTEPPASAPSAGVDAIAAATALRPGQRFAARYDIRHMVGAGGAGVVFLATDTRVDDTVALKVLRPDLLQQDATAPSRLAREVEIARRLSHPNIVQVRELGEADGLHYITMEYVQGSTLRQLIDARGALPIPVVLSLAKQLCRALEHAHQRGVIHRDIKPHNVVVTSDGTLKVMDFGTARLVEAPRGLTESGVLFGTPAYMAPESLRGGTVDARADVYAAGVVLYEALVGRQPFAALGAASPLVVLTHVLESPPRDPVELNAGVPRALADVVLRTLAKDPAQRPQTASALLEQLGAVA